MISYFPLLLHQHLRKCVMINIGSVFVVVSCRWTYLIWILPQIVLAENLMFQCFIRDLLFFRSLLWRSQRLRLAIVLHIYVILTLILEPNIFKPSFIHTLDSTQSRLLHARWQRLHREHIAHRSVILTSIRWIPLYRDEKAFCQLFKFKRYVDTYSYSKNKIWA